MLCKILKLDTNIIKTATNIMFVVLNDIAKEMQSYKAVDILHSKSEWFFIKNSIVLKWTVWLYVRCKGVFSSGVWCGLQMTGSAVIIPSVLN